MLCLVGFDAEGDGAMLNEKCACKKRLSFFHLMVRTVKFYRHMLKILLKTTLIAQKYYF